MRHMRVSDTPSYFGNRVFGNLRDALKVEHQFAVAYSPWTNGTCEWMVWEVIRTLKSILLEERRSMLDWVQVVPAVQ